MTSISLKRLSIHLMIASGVTLQVGCAMKERESVVFNASRAGAQAKIEISSTVMRAWQAIVVIASPKEHPETGALERRLLLQDITGVDAKLSDVTQPHRGLNLTVQWLKREGGNLRVVESYTVTQEYVTGVPGGLGIGVGKAVCLPQGDYMVSITQNENDYRLIGKDIRFFVGSNPFLKC